MGDLTMAEINVIETTATVVSTSYRLELSKDELTTLFAILARIGGATKTTRRKHANTISAAIATVLGPDNWDTTDLHGDITFEDQPV
jgi:hypothetical protein